MRKVVRPKTAATAFLLIALLAAALPAQSRQWSKNPLSAARDYAIITDNRGPGEVVAVIWLAPTMLPNDPKTTGAREILEKNTVIGVVHVHSSSDGTAKFDRVDTLDASDGDGVALKSLDAASMSPAMVGALATVQTVFGRNLGPFGQGVQWFVFESGATHACAKGGLGVRFAGEKYTYDTPMPGCP